MSVVRSTEASIGRILLLVGAIVAVFMAVLMLGMLALLGASVGASPVGPPPPVAFLPLGMLVFMGALGIAGAVVGFVAYGKADREPRRAGVLGIVAAVLPPTNLFALVGGIMLLVSPEAKAAAPGRPAPSPPIDHDKP